MRLGTFTGLLVIASFLLAPAVRAQVTAPNPSETAVGSLAVGAAVPAVNAPPPGGSIASAGERLPPVSFLRQTTFAIPFNVSGNTAEVQLYVSNDRGSTWHLYAEQRPDAKRFRFRASQDGEYWFASRTVDRKGQGRPASIVRPERRVVVDTRQPRLAVQLALAANGEIQASWEIDDENLAPPSFRLGYRTDINPSWQLVATPGVEATPGKPVVGQTSWRPPQGARVLQLHAEVADQAGNWGVVEKQLSIAPTAPGSLSSNIPAVPATGNNASFRPVNDQATGSPANAALSTAPATNGGLGRSMDGSNSLTNPAGASSATGASSAPADLTGDERPRMTSSKRFSLEYDIESAGPGGVADVELWMSRDRGATWSRYGVDPDKASPFEVEVDADGIYGVRIVIVSKSGLASTAPRAGDPADLWVGVDTTRPTVQFSSVSYGEGQNAGQLDIRWLADDQRFGPRPITLAYAETSAGPWTAIASGLPNTGQYLWAVDSHVPKKIVLRIEVRDEAGNSAQQELNEPISLQGLAPAARVRGIQPR